MLTAAAVGALCIGGEARADEGDADLRDRIRKLEEENARLRERLGEMGDRLKVEVHFPAMEYCTDNGAMIAYAGGLRLDAGQQDVNVTDVLPRWSLEDLAPV